MDGPRTPRDRNAAWTPSGAATGAPASVWMGGAVAGCPDTSKTTRNKNIWLWCLARARAFNPSSVRGSLRQRWPGTATTCPMSTNLARAFCLTHETAPTCHRTPSPIPSTSGHLAWAKQAARDANDSQDTNCHWRSGFLRLRPGDAHAEPYRSEAIWVSRRTNQRARRERRLRGWLTGAPPTMARAWWTEGAAGPRPATTRMPSVPSGGARPLSRNRLAESAAKCGRVRPYLVRSGLKLGRLRAKLARCRSGIARNLPRVHQIWTIWNHAIAYSMPRKTSRRPCGRPPVDQHERRCTPFPFSTSCGDFPKPPPQTNPRAAEEEVENQQPPQGTSGGAQILRLPSDGLLAHASRVPLGTCERV